jgi:hypothetical protein
MHWPKSALIGIGGATTNADRKATNNYSLFSRFAQQQGTGKKFATNERMRKRVSLS